MKFAINSTDLLNTLAGPAAIVPTKAYNPAIECLLLEVSHGELTVLATDMAVWLSASEHVDVLEGTSMRAMVKPKELLDTLRKIDDQPVSLTFGDDEKLVLKTKNGKYTISAQQVGEFPPSPEVDQNTQVGIPCTTLNRAMSKTLFAAANEDIKPVMCGILVSLSPSGTDFVATDAHRLSRFHVAGITFGQEYSFILPRAAMKQLINICAANNQFTAQMTFDSYKARFEINNNVLICSLIDGRFPDYKQVIPTSFDGVAEAYRQDLLASMKRLSIYANSVTHLGVFTFKHGEIIAEAESSIVLHSAQERIGNVNYEGQDNFKIGFNLALLREVVANAETDTVSLHMSTPNRPVVVKPESNEDGEELVMVVMPVMMGVS